jgi:GT2 family glycosyltransferase
VFAVGCAEKENSKSTRISGKGCGAFQRGMMVHWRCPTQSRGNSLWVSGGSGAFRRSIWLELNGMDELFKPAYEEDRDICYRALKRGYRVMFEPESLVYHQHETTNRSVIGERNMQVASYKNQFLIVWKNLHSNRLLIKHLAWLPYHLTVGGMKTNGLLLKGFLQALKQLPPILKLRKAGKEKALVADEELL